MFVKESLKVHSSGHTSNGTSSATLAHSLVDRCYAADLGGSVGHSEFLVDVGNCAVRTYVSTSGASVTHKLVGMSNAGVTGKLILAEESDYLGCCRACLRNGLGNVLGTLTCARKEYACRGAFYGTKLGVSLGEEIVCVHTCRKHSSQGTSRLVGLDSRSENYEIGINVELLVSDKIGSLNLELLALGSNLSNHTLNVVNSLFLNGSAIELVEVLSGGTNVYVEYVNVGVGIFITYKHCMLCGIHTADLGAVFLTLFSASRAT